MISNVYLFGFMFGLYRFDKDIKPEHDNNIYISGFSDQILR